MLLSCLHLVGSADAPAPENTDQQADKPLITLRKIYLSCHGLDWIGMTPDDPRRQEPLWEQWPGRCELIHPLDFEFRLRIYQMIRNAREDEGLLVIPSGNPANDEMIAYAQERMGPRCVVVDLNYDPARAAEVLGPDFVAGIQDDRQRALECRAQDVTDAQFENELQAWERSRTWAANLTQNLAAAGYTFDPATVEFVCWGGDWRGCAATYPIQMGRALGLASPIERRWDLIIHDAGPLDVKSKLVVQNVCMPNDIRLFIFKTEHGRYCAEYWEGLHSPLEKAHLITVQFPPDSVRRVDRFGRPVGDGMYGSATVTVGCGGHTPHCPGILEAIGALTLDDFYAALVAGKVSEKP